MGTAGKLAALLFAASLNMANAAEKIRYVALGDSYTIGEGASPNESWPALLTRHLKAEGVDVDLIANPSVTGWTTQQLLDHELPIYRKSNPNFATLLIGVNDWVQGVSAEKFRNNLNHILDEMLKLLPNRSRLLVITIPDFGVTPTGPKYARGRNISEGITSFNRIVTDESQKRGLRVVDLFPESKRMAKDRSLVAIDGLHPSAKAYTAWEKIIFPAAVRLLKG